MRVCNSNDMHNLKLKDVGRGYACYYGCMPSPPMLLHIYCSCLSNFWHCHLYILQHFNVNVLLIFVVYLLANTMLFACTLYEPHPFCCWWSYEMDLSNNKEKVLIK